MDVLATSVAKEGLDIPEVDHVVFYEPCSKRDTLYIASWQDEKTGIRQSNNPNS